LEDGFGDVFVDGFVLVHEVVEVRDVGGEHAEAGVEVGAVEVVLHDGVDEAVLVAVCFAVGEVFVFDDGGVFSDAISGEVVIVGASHRYSSPRELHPL
jgi:hypothetical protein